MVSDRTVRNQQRRSSVGSEQDLPACGVDVGGWSGGVCPGERNGEASASGRLEDATPCGSVVPVGPHAAGHGESGGVEHGGDRPSDRSDPDVAFADVVQERRLDRCRVVPDLRFDAAGDGDGVFLVGGTLGPEGGGARRGEVVVNVLLVGGTGRCCTEMAEEPSGQVDDGRRVPFHDEEDLHLTQSVDVGRYAMRSAPIEAPHFRQVP